MLGDSSSFVNKNIDTVPENPQAKENEIKASRGSKGAEAGTHPSSKENLLQESMLEETFVADQTEGEKHIQAPIKLHFRKHAGRNSSSFVNKNIYTVTENHQAKENEKKDNRGSKGARAGTHPSSKEISLQEACWKKQ